MEEWREQRVSQLANGVQSSVTNVDQKLQNGVKSEPKPHAGKLVQETQEVLTPVELLERLGRKVVGVNMLEVVEYLKKSKVCVVHRTLLRF